MAKSHTHLSLPNTDRATDQADGLFSPCGCARALVEALVSDDWAGDADQYQPTVDRLCQLNSFCYLCDAVAAMHKDLMRGEAIECYNSELFWCQENLDSIAAGSEDDENGDRARLCGTSDHGEAVARYLDAIAANYFNGIY